MRDLARFYHHWYARVLTSFQDRFGGDLLGAFRTLQDEGLIEIATSAATHGYLPLLARDSSIHGQLHTGVETYRRHFGRSPQAVWLPECAYRPAIIEDDGGQTVRRPGLESFLAEEGLLVFFSETHTVEGGRPVGMAVPGDDRAVRHDRPALRLEHHSARAGPAARAGHLTPALLGRRRAGPGRRARPGTSAPASRSGRRRSAIPGDFVYREFHRKDADIRHAVLAGHRSRRRPRQQGAVRSESRRRSGRSRTPTTMSTWSRSSCGSITSSTGEFGSITAVYDTELFGHWWFEGVDWLKAVLRGLAARPAVELSTASRIVEEHPPHEVLSLPESSWGAGGGHFTWLNDDTEWMWPLIHAAERRMEDLADALPGRRRHATGACSTRPPASFSCCRAATGHSS